MAGHPGTIARDQEILADGKQVFAIVPGRGNQRDATGQRLENTNGRNAWERSGIRAPRDMYGHAVLRKDLGDAVIRKPPAILYARFRQFLECMSRIADSVYTRLEAERLHRADEEFPNLLSSLAVAPITDPNEIACRDAASGIKQPSVRGLVPSPGAAGPLV